MRPPSRFLSRPAEQIPRNFAPMSLLPSPSATCLLIRDGLSFTPRSHNDHEWMSDHLIGVARVNFQK